MKKFRLKLRERRILGVLVLLVCTFLFFSLRKEKTQLNSNVENSKIREELRKQFSSYQEATETSGEEITVSLVAEESEINLIEGVKTKVWAYNKQIPGPEIRVSLGDTLTVNLTNNLPQATTIHWHGVRVPNDMDGVPDVTQEPILPGETFTYSFTPKDTGTFWFHPHVRGSEQVEKGLYGTLIVEDPSEPAYDSDTTLVIDDWRVLDDWQIDPRFVTPHDLMHDGRWGNVITVNSSLNEQLSLAAGTVNKLRFVNTSNARVYAFDFGSLAPYSEVIAVDGMKVGEAFNVQGFELAPGNRVDVAVRVPLELEGKSTTVSDIFTRSRNTLLTVEILSQINSVFSSVSLPIDESFPDWSQAISLVPDTEYILDARRKSGMGMMNIEWTINGRAYPDYDPITLEYNKVQKLRFTNKSSRLHPMHLHGQFFQVIARDGELVHEPYWRDTVLLHPKETVDIVLLPLDKGRWVSHCHILEHADAGMMTVIEVK